MSESMERMTKPMKVWIVMDGDHDSAWVVAVYQHEALAKEHVAALDGYITESELLEHLHPDVNDQSKIRARAAEIEKSRIANESYNAEMERQAKSRAETRPSPPHMSLCHCATFSKDGWFINDHGYCGYCGGFTPIVFLQHMGREAMNAEIDKLAIHDREKMRELVRAL